MDGTGKEGGDPGGGGTREAGRYGGDEGEDEKMRSREVEKTRMR